MRFDVLRKCGQLSMAFGLPINEAVARMETTAQALRASAAKMPSRCESPGERLKAAVKSRLHSGFTTIAQQLRADGEESFGQKVKEAVEKKSGRKQHEEQAERERSRYPRPRQRTKGE